MSARSFALVASLLTAVLGLHFFAAPPVPLVPTRAAAETVPAPRLALTPAARIPSVEESCAQLLRLPAAERVAAAAALLLANAEDSARARAIATQLCANDPAFVREHGHTLIALLVESGDALAAEKFSAAGGPESTVWLDTTFRLWAAHAPRAATLAAASRPDGDGFSAATATWARNDPSALASFAVENLAGTRQAIALEQALTAWYDRDAQAASAWITRLESAPSPAETGGFKK